MLSAVKTVNWRVYIQAFYAFMVRYWRQPALLILTGAAAHLVQIYTLLPREYYRHMELRLLLID